MLHRSSIQTIRVAFVTLVLAALVLRGEEPDSVPFPKTDSIKGLQVQMTSDALALGIRHATINVSLTPLLKLSDPFASYNEDYLRSLDAQIDPLAKAGVVVYAILLATPSKDPARDSIVLHPDARSDHKYTIAGFNSVTEQGRRWFSGAVEMLARRWRGKVWGWIIGNELNSHWLWYNMGTKPMENAVAQYEQAFRLAHSAIRSVSQNARTYISLDHHWKISMAGISANEAAPGRDFLDTFARVVKERGDFDWNVAHHPYPEDLGNPRLWADKNINSTDETIKVTFKNLEVLERHLMRQELLYNGKPRRIILSEQGFHTLATPEGEVLQAAAFVYAWEKCQRVSLVDAFIYHRHVDHAHEGGVKFGLWTNKPGSVAEPERQKKIYQVFKAAGTPAWAEVSAFALPICGVKSWEEAWK
ncbi:MAG: hypothetical protein JNJ83_20195 [Verrucomicrobiaceae bacterium]|nr:hypothetical protein [Verrucomicrobiaceae bacterium]